MELVRLSDYTAQERAALITFQILEGQKMTTSEIAAHVGVTWLGAYRMMEKISRVVPVVQEDAVWRRAGET